MSDGGNGLSKAGRRVLESAAALFYAQGIHSVGIDLVATHSGVTKATLYQQFRSKDELVAACLREHAESWQRFVAAPARATRGGAKHRVANVFNSLGTAFGSSAYRGCPFINAAAEYPSSEGVVASAIADHRTDVRDLFIELLDDTPGRGRTAHGEQIVLLYDGAKISAQFGGGRNAAATAGKAAAHLIETWTRNARPPHQD